jgi:hypothetical protein
MNISYYEARMKEDGPHLPPLFAQTFAGRMESLLMHLAYGCRRCIERNATTETTLNNCLEDPITATEYLIDEVHLRQLQREIDVLVNRQAQLIVEIKMRREAQGMNKRRWLPALCDRRTFIMKSRGLGSPLRETWNLDCEEEAPSDPWEHWNSVLPPTRPMLVPQSDTNRRDNVSSLSLASQHDHKNWISEDEW